jgi:hypothetical protein
LSDVLKFIRFRWIILLITLLAFGIVILFSLSDVTIKQIIKSIEFISGYPGLSGLLILAVSPIIFLMLAGGLVFFIEILRKKLS